MCPACPYPGEKTLLGSSNLCYLLPWIASTWEDPVLKAGFGRLEFLSSDEWCRIPAFPEWGSNIGLVLFHGPRVVLSSPDTGNSSGLHRSKRGRREWLDVESFRLEKTLQRWSPIPDLTLSCRKG